MISRLRQTMFHRRWTTILLQQMKLVQASFQFPADSSDSVTVIPKPDNFPKSKRKKPEPSSVKYVRRSCRIASLNAGFKNKASADEHASNAQVTLMNLSGHFEAIVMDNNSAPLPILPVDIIQAIGTSFCQIPPGEVSAANLNYDSSNDSA